MEKDLERAFSREYMDAEDTVGLTVRILREYTNTYIRNGKEYVAPYTSIVTSSMMGKSRHMKQVANHLPSIYICLRTVTAGKGYPHPTPEIVPWLQKGLSSLVNESSISIDEYFSCLATYRWAAFITSAVETLTEWIITHQLFDSRNKASIDKRFLFGRLWQFFAEPPNRDLTDLSKFWSEVLKATAKLLVKCKDPDPEKPSSLRGNLAWSIFQRDRGQSFTAAMENFQKSIAQFGVTEKYPLIFIFDEARTLCDYDASDGSRVYDDYEDYYEPPGRLSPRTIYKDPNPRRSFTHFHALRRSARYITVESEIKSPKIFVVLTDTASRVTNFQPTPWKDNSMRVPELPEGGLLQFPPIFVFASVDVYSRVLNEELCTSNIRNVAMNERLLRFGRAGWYTIYNKSSEGDPTLMIRTLAKAKLLGRSDARFPTDTGSRGNLVQLLAVLGPRLALTIGPMSSEASQLIASHLAVLTQTDKNRHFLRTIYPSEPLLAEASAELTNDYGWALPLCALCEYVRSGIVEAGYRGELLTKIMCLMAMDNALNSISTPSRHQWKFSRPVSVSAFLNHLIVPPENFPTFTKYIQTVESRDKLENKDLIKHAELRHFLGGYVFFNHFIRIDIQLCYSMLFQAWNRGAAIMCMTNTKGIDFVIPVVLDTEPGFQLGPLHGVWNTEDIQQVRPHLSAIFINSKLYATATAQVNAAWATKFYSENLADYGTVFARPSPVPPSQSSSSALPPQPPSPTTTGSNRKKRKRKGKGKGKSNVKGKSLAAEASKFPEVECQEMEGVEEHGPRGKMFMSLLQDFGPKLDREEWVTVRGLRTSDYPNTRASRQNEEETQLVVVLKGIGTETYQCLRDPEPCQDPEEIQIMQQTRQYLQQLSTTRVNYVEENNEHERPGKQNIPMVYGPEWLGSEQWQSQRNLLQQRWYAEREAELSSEARGLYSDLGDRMEDVVAGP